MRRITMIMMAILIGLVPLSLRAEVPAWGELARVEAVGEGYRTTGDDPWMVSEVLATPIAQERQFMLLEMTINAPTQCQIFWSLGGEGFGGDRHTFFNFPAAPDTPALVVIALNSTGSFLGADQLRFDPGHTAGYEFQIHRMEFLTLEQVPEETRRQLIDFRAISSKLHYLPGEAVPWRVSLFANMVLEQEASKILTVTLREEASGREVAREVQQVGLHPLFDFMTIHGRLEPEEAGPGAYLLEAEMVDQQTGATHSSVHKLGILGPDAPFFCETPFKFVKDFSIIRDKEGVFHVFSITGDLLDKHDWTLDGQERTFSHGTSPDLRHWTWHEPVLSISDDPYPDGVGFYEDRNIWAPHVIEHEGRYYMLYTSVNQYVSQSISLAVSDDLYHWEKYEDNPVFTLEGEEWADWERDAWADNRDPVVLQDNGKFYIYTTARRADQKGVVAVAESEDLINWEKVGIAVVREPAGAPESPQVWKQGDKYYLTANGVDAVSDDPLTGWTAADWPLDPLPGAEPYVETSANYANEVIRLSNGKLLMATLTWRYWGNSIYIFQIETDPETGDPTGTTSPFAIPDLLSKSEINGYE